MRKIESEGGHWATAVGTSKNQLSFQAMPRAFAPSRILCISSREGETPFSQRETEPCRTPAIEANSAWFTLKTWVRMYRIGFMRQILFAKE